MTYLNIDLQDGEIPFDLDRTTGFLYFLGGNSRSSLQSAFIRLNTDCNRY
jgi:hypothetical protein